MKVQTPKHTKITKIAKKLSKEEVQARIKAKFGKDVQKKKPVAKDKTDIETKGVKSSDDEDFGDVGSNNPANQITHDKIKDLLKTGAFKFSDRERATLSKILK